MNVRSPKPRDTNWCYSVRFGFLYKFDVCMIGKNYCIVYLYTQTSQIDYFQRVHKILRWIGCSDFKRGKPRAWRNMIRILMTQSFAFIVCSRSKFEFQSDICQFKNENPFQIMQELTLVWKGTKSVSTRSVARVPVFLQSISHDWKRNNIKVYV